MISKKRCIFNIGRDCTRVDERFLISSPYRVRSLRIANSASTLITFHLGRRKGSGMSRCQYLSFDFLNNHRGKKESRSCCSPRRMIFILKNSYCHVSALKEGKHEEIFNIAKHFINTARFLISRVISMEYFYGKYGYESSVEIRRF